MRRVLILGNAGSGKSTLARRLGAENGATVLDLDTLVWVPGRIAVPRPADVVRADLHAFCESHESWIIEGCYGDLAEVVLDGRTELILLDPGEAACLENCRRRPWEPHKFATPAEQDARLGQLLAWVSEYYHRDGAMSLRGHRALYDAYAGPKRRLP